MLSLRVLKAARFHVVVAVLTAVLGGGCSASSTSGSTGATTSATEPTLPPTTCEPGTMPTLLGATCAPVGTTACAPGFEKDASGWGCTAIVPASPCALPMRAKLGSRECVPVDDCTAPFPPPGAHAVVTPNGALTLGDALEAAPTGATIAVDSGTYELKFVARRDVKLVGRCASKVKLHSAKKNLFLLGEGAHLDIRSVSMSAPDGSAIYAIENGHATLSNVIIAGAGSGVTSSRGSSVRVVSSSLIGDRADAREDSAAAVAMHGGQVTLEDVDIRDFVRAVAVLHEGTKVKIERSLVVSDGPLSRMPMLFVLNGGALEVNESLLLAPRSVVLSVSNEPAPSGAKPGPGAPTVVVRSEISQRGAPRAVEYAVFVYDGGRATFEETTVHYASDAAISVLGAASSLITKSSVFRVTDVAEGMVHAALLVLNGASSDMEGSAIVSPVQYGTVTLGAGSRSMLSGSLITGTKWRPTNGGGSDGAAIAMSVVEGATASLTASAIVGSEQYGIHTGLGSLVTANDVIIDATSAPPTGGGSAIIVDQTARIAATRCAIRNSADAAFVIRGGGSVVGESTIVGNAVVLRLGGATLTELPSPPSSASAITEVIFYANRLHDNGSFVSDQLPAPVVPPPFFVTPP